MKHIDKIRLFLDIQENPGKYSDKELSTMLDSDEELAELFQQSSLTKQALAKDLADKEEIPTDDLWAQFAEGHSEELEALDSANEVRKSKSSVSWLRKIAAVFVGTLVFAGIVYAAIRIIHNPSESPTEKTLTDSDTLIVNKTAKDSTVVHFNNVPLDSILSVVAPHFKKDVVFLQEEVRKMKFIMNWDAYAPLDEFIDRLNDFEVINLDVKGDSIIVVLGGEKEAAQ